MKIEFDRSKKKLWSNLDPFESQNLVPKTVVSRNYPIARRYEAYKLLYLNGPNLFENQATPKPKERTKFAKQSFVFSGFKKNKAHQNAGVHRAFFQARKKRTWLAKRWKEEAGIEPVSLERCSQWHSQLDEVEDIFWLDWNYDAPKS